MTSRTAAAYIIASLSLLFVSACSLHSQHGPVNSTHFEQIVERSLGDDAGGKIHKSLRASWIPHKKKEPIRGVFVVTHRGLVFTTWDDPQKHYRLRYRVPYKGLRSVRLHKDDFKRRLQVRTRSDRVDHFEILTQSIKPPYVVDNGLTDETFELLKKLRREQTSKQRAAPDEIDFQRKVKKIKRKRPAKRKPSSYDDY